jgi:hypothetical protein
MAGRLEKHVKLALLEVQVQITNDKRTQRYKYGFVTEQRMCLESRLDCK